MCIAILAGPNKHLTKEQLENCWTSNPHGAGFVYVKDGKFIFVKELLKREKFFKLYEKHLEDAKDSPMLVHFRVRTHGDISIANTQPIQVDHNTAFIHNGVINCVPSHEHHSDTVMFSRMILRRIRPGFHNHEKILTMIDNVVGYSKLVFLGIDKTVGIVGEKRGQWIDGIWYSNTSHKTFITKVEKKTGTNVAGNACGIQQSFPTVPTRMLEQQKPYQPNISAGSSASGGGSDFKPLTQFGSGIKTGVELEWHPGAKCSGCDDDFSRNELWYEVYNKYLVCYGCMKQWRDIHVPITASGRWVPKKEDKKAEATVVAATPDKLSRWDEEQRWREAYGCD